MSNRRTHKFIISVTFDKPTTKRHALASVKDCICGYFWPSQIDGADPGMFKIRGFKSIPNAKPSPTPTACPEGYGLKEGVQLSAKNIASIKAVLDGNLNGLFGAFKWKEEKHGADYWVARTQYIDAEPLTEDDLRWLRHLLQGGE